MGLTGAGIHLQPVTDCVLSSLVQTGVLEAALIKKRRRHLAVTARKRTPSIHNQPTEPHRLGLHKHIQSVSDVEAYACVDCVLPVVRADVPVAVAHHEWGVICRAGLSQATARAGVSTAHLAEGVPLGPGHAPVSGGKGGRRQRHALAEAAGSVVEVAGQSQQEEGVPVERYLQAEICLQNELRAPGEDVDLPWAQLQRKVQTLLVHLREERFNKTGSTLNRSNYYSMMHII